MESLNSIATGDPYGKKGDTNWQQIALAEGWANYREWDLARRYLNWNTISGVSWISDQTNPLTIKTDNNWYPENYSALFYELRNTGCSFANMEKSLCTYTIAGFRDNLTAKYPSIKTQITKIVKDYE